MVNKTTSNVLLEERAKNFSGFCLLYFNKYFKDDQQYMIGYLLEILITCKTANKTK